ncbi:MAG: response regulator transcription factor [Kineosporiaceae bacterium]|nr:response regulator transcription factor [Kineosporiaceae bacterium]MBK8078074.1 response regulator transcription factor [Kineosporiaceae bacterium]
MRVVVAEDMALLRAGLSRLLEAESIEVVAEVGDAPALLSAVAALRPDVALVDIKMPPTHTDEGLRAAVDIRQRNPATAVLLLSSYLDVRYASQLLDLGSQSCGYLLKDRVAHPAVLVDALHRVCAEECVLDPAVVTQLLGRSRVAGPLDQLSAREREILSLMAEGHSNARICILLSLSQRTVESHVRNIFNRLGLDESPDSSRRVLAVLTYLKG